MDFVMQMSDGSYYACGCFVENGDVRVVDVMKAEVVGDEVRVDFGTPWTEVDSHIAKYGDEIVKEAKKRMK